MYRLLHRHKIMKKKLIQWNKKSVGNIFKFVKCQSKVADYLALALDKYLMSRFKRRLRGLYF